MGGALTGPNAQYDWAVLIEEICQHVELGGALEPWFNDPDHPERPAISTFYKALRSNPDWWARYVEAQKLRSLNAIDKLDAVTNQLLEASLNPELGYDVRGLSYTIKALENRIQNMNPQVFAMATSKRGPDAATVDDLRRAVTEAALRIAAARKAEPLKLTVIEAEYTELEEKPHADNG